MARSVGRLSWTTCPAEVTLEAWSPAVTFVIYDGFDGLDLAGPSPTDRFAAKALQPVTRPGRQEQVV